MILYIIFGFIGGICAALPFILKRKKIDNSLFLELNKQTEELQKNLDTLTQNIDQSTKVYNNLSKTISELTGQKQEIEKSIETDQRLAKQSVEAIYKTSYENMAQRLEETAEKFSQQFEDCSNEYSREYELMLTEYVQDFLKSHQFLQEELEKTKKELENEHSKTISAIEANKREEEKHLAQNKYRISLSDTDKLEIQRLKELIPYMRNSRPISKIIWEVYYRTPTNDLISRTIGPNICCGIYKITNLLNNKTYIGQSNDIGERWKAHIKCGLGIDTPNNLLYKAMLQDGVENFAFEVLEKCQRNRLNEQEIYWIDYYKSQDYGYNMTKGGSKC